MTTPVDGAAGAPSAGPAAGNGGAGMRVALLGHGAIGRVVARELLAGAVDGATLVAVVRRSEEDGLPVPHLDLEQALEISDVVVEVAGADAAREAIEPVLTAGRDLLVSSVGALLDPELRSRLADLGPGRLRCTHGALGGLDMLASAAAACPLDSVVLRTTKLPSSLLRPWMDEQERRRLTEATGDVQVFRGTPLEAVRLFPQSVNVAAALALAVGDVDTVVVELHADPAATLTTHRVQAAGRSGTYSFEVRHRPSPDNPRTSDVVPYSVLQTLRGMTAAPPLIA
jgi:aspartate dehydrogenase